MTWSLTDRSLCQFRGITQEKERELYAAGVKDGEALLRYLLIHGPKGLQARVASCVSLFRTARKLGLVDVIVNMFPVGARTRVVSDRFEKTLFFDIETDGMGRRAHVTMISAVMNGRERVFVRGVDLLDFLELWNEAEIIVSFNGKRFDVPVLMHEFGMSRVPAHVDLMDEGRCFGLRGGLKEIETVIGFVRSKSNCRSGIDAIGMWREYLRTGSRDALEMLMRYNLDDVRSLMVLYRHLLPLEVEGLFDH